MIVVDTSAIVAIARGEPDHEAFGSAMADEGAIIGTPTIVEVKFVLSSILDPAVVDTMIDRLGSDGGLRSVAFTQDMADAAVEAFRRYGKGRGHPAQLNYGDCMSYAVARVRGLPLLFKGNDFSKTDIVPALA